MSIPSITPINFYPSSQTSSIIKKDVLFDVATPFDNNLFSIENDNNLFSIENDNNLFSIENDGKQGNLVICHGQGYDVEDGQKERYPNSYTMDLSPDAGSMFNVDATHKDKVDFIPSNSLKSITFDRCQGDMYMKIDFLTLWLDKLVIGGVLNLFGFPPLIVYLNTLYPMLNVSDELKQINKIKRQIELKNISEDHPKFNTKTLSYYLKNIGLKSSKSLYTTIISNINRHSSVLIIKLS